MKERTDWWIHLMRGALARAKTEIKKVTISPGMLPDLVFSPRKKNLLVSGTAADPYEIVPVSAAQESGHVRWRYWKTGTKRASYAGEAQVEAERTWTVSKLEGELGAPGPGPGGPLTYAIPAYQGAVDIDSLEAETGTMGHDSWVWFTASGTCGGPDGGVYGRITWGTSREHKFTKRAEGEQWSERGTFEDGSFLDAVLTMWVRYAPGYPAGDVGDLMKTTVKGTAEPPAL